MQNDDLEGSKDRPELEDLGARGHLMFSPSAVVFSFSDEHRKQAASCLRRNGEVKISFSDISITDLSGIRQLNGDGGVAVD